jgi:hypothetical protein
MTLRTSFPEPTWRPEAYTQAESRIERSFAIGVKKVVERFKRRWPDKYMDETTVRDRSHKRKHHEFIRKLGHPKVRIIRDINFTGLELAHYGVAEVGTAPERVSSDGKRTCRNSPVRVCYV